MSLENPSDPGFTDPKMKRPKTPVISEQDAIKWGRELVPVLERLEKQIRALEAWGQIIKHCGGILEARQFVKDAAANGYPLFLAPDEDGVEMPHPDLMEP